jgi:plasmid stability protein
MKRNLTIQLDDTTLRRARIQAAKRGRSMTRYVADLVAEDVTRDEEYDQAMREELLELGRGFNLGGGPYLSRDEAHERR